MSEEAEVDLTLGEGARDRGPLCDRIPRGPAAAGVGYVVLDGDPSALRVRFSYLDDDDIAEMAWEYDPRRILDGDWTDPKPLGGAV
jgi:S-DNA-T family DNA segregation ATPase FtsK/SpoIIIE